MNNDRLNANLPLLCNKTEDYMPFYRGGQVYDTVKYYIRPLECKDKYDYFRNKVRGFNETKFWDWCVNFDNGDPKPQVRLHNTRSYFNVSNFM